MSQGYRIEIVPHSGLVTAYLGETEVARSDDVKILKETRLGEYYYFPLDAIDATKLERSDHRTFCPFKGTATYWHLKTPNGLIENAVWSYQTPLEESKQIAGLISFMGKAADRYAFENQPADVQDSQQNYISSALSDWVLREAGNQKSRVDLVRMLGKKFVESGIQVYRMSIMIWSLHPQIAGVNFRWYRDTDEVEVLEPRHEIFEDSRYINSPINLVTKGAGGVRQQLNRGDMEFEFPILEELKAEGGTDYVAMPLRFSDGKFHCMTMACDHHEGFTTKNLGMVFECIGVISRYFEVLTLRKNTTTLLDTYLGKRTGQKVLNGDIHRGQGENIQAVILFSDLRNSTKMAETLSRENYLQLLNQYFEKVLTPVGENGGEVLKFIGDAVLAIFPVSDTKGDQLHQVQNALTAAKSIVTDICHQLDNSHNEDGCEIDLGISLHIGEVTYGNVGGQERLDFTVIGPAVNMASRLEGLCKSCDCRIIVSQDFKNILERDEAENSLLKSIGKFQLSGISDNHEVFVPIESNCTIPKGQTT